MLDFLKAFCYNYIHFFLSLKTYYNLLLRLLACVIFKKGNYLWVIRLFEIILKDMENGL